MKVHVHDPSGVCRPDCPSYVGTASSARMWFDGVDALHKTTDDDSLAV